MHEVEPREQLDAEKKDIRGFGKYFRHKTALSDTCGPQNLFVTKIPEASSLLRPHLLNLKRWRGDDAGFEIVSEATVHCETLGAFSTRINLNGCDLLKLDTQGSELNILLSGIEFVCNTSIISIEVEFVRLYEGQYLFDDIVRELSNLGFRFVNFTHGQSLDGLEIGRAHV